MSDLSSPLLLIGISFATSTLTAMAGMGGGVLLLSLLPLFLHPLAVVPIHGAVQLASNVSRSALALPSIQWPLVAPFFIGALLGAATGSRLVVFVPVHYLPALLGGFILMVTWVPMTQARVQLPGKFLGLGFLNAFLTLFVGATGPLNIPFLLREEFRRDQLIATQAVLMTCIHGIKVLTFGLLGFAFRDYAHLTAGMILAVIAGSFAGTRVRSRISENRFRKICKGLITLLAIRMVFRGFF